MENKVTFKEQYHMGMDLLKKDIEECKNDKLYSQIVKYFEYPISLMEQEVNETITNNNDTEEYYIEKCEEIEKLYNRLAMTTAIISKRFTPITTKIKRKCKNAIFIVLADNNE